MQTHLGLILACARALVSCLQNLAITKVLTALLLLTGLSFVCISQASAQVKEVTTLLELARTSTIDLQALPLADQRANMLLTQGLEQLQQAQKLADNHMDQLGAAQGPLSGADRNLTRLQLARVTYIRGELYRLAATKYPVTDPIRQAYLDSAVMIFTDMRKTFNSINDAQLARVGLARCYRLLGQLDQAIDILKPLLRLPDPTQQPVNENQLNLWRAAIVEELEIMLLQSPQAAIKQVHMWMTHRAFAQQTNWTRSLKRIDALAAVQLALINPTPNPVTLAVKRLADSPLPAAAQLQYLMQLEFASDLPIISPQQRNDWVLLIVDTLHAQQAVDRINRQIPDPSVLNAQAVMAYGSVLWQVGKLGRAVNSFDRAMQLTDTGDPLHATALHWQAQCLYQQAIASPNTNLRKRAQSALSQLLQTHQSKAVRLTALKQWVNLKHADQGLTAAATLITQHAQLANQDPYLQYVLLTDQWQQLQKIAQQQTLQTNAIQKKARLLIGKAKAAADIALANQDSQIAGGLMQLQARIYASPLLKQTPIALTLLDQAHTLLNQPQTQLKILLLIQNNEIETLWQLLQTSTDNQLDSPTWMLLVEAFANNARQNADNTKLAERAQKLAIRAWHTNLLVTDQIRIANALILLRSWDVCLTLLGHEPHQDNNPQLNLAIGQALLGENRDLEQAVKVLSQVTASLPQSPQAHLWLAMAYARGEQHSKATPHYRSVRKLEKPATLTWWHGTLGLTQSLAAMGQTQEARQILQVTLTLYQVIGDDALKQDLIQLLGKLQK